jgi:hypothetical protein
MEKRRGEERRRQAAAQWSVERRQGEDRRQPAPVGGSLELTWMAQNAHSLSLLFRQLEGHLRAAASANPAPHLEAADRLRAEIEVRIADLQMGLFSRPLGPPEDALRDDA